MSTVERVFIVQRRSIPAFIFWRSGSIIPLGRGSGVPPPPFQTSCRQHERVSKSEFRERSRQEFQRPVDGCVCCFFDGTGTKAIFFFFLAVVERERGGQEA